MLDFSALEEKCPKCNGKGGIENGTWYHNWIMRNSKCHVWDTKDKPKDQAPQDQPGECMYSFCENCNGRGKILTTEGKRLIEIVRFWMNSNY
ncbi:MAG: hypothetical protein Q8911_15555 [Bacillota bacterium]|nr:hypothetical protein [Bacillota bacterium]